MDFVQYANRFHCPQSCGTYHFPAVDSIEMTQKNYFFAGEKGL